MRRKHMSKIVIGEEEEEEEEESHRYIPIKGSTYQFSLSSSS
jgi:hypothetical protein